MVQTAIDAQRRGGDADRHSDNELGSNIAVHGSPVDRISVPDNRVDK